MEQVPVYAVRLRRLREQKKMKRRVASELCGLSKNMMKRYENGEVEPKASALILLADFYGVSVDYILGVEDGENNLQKSPYMGRGF